jgi:hypothetical protein
MWSEPGQQIIREAIREKGLDGVVVACCSPSMHENTFRKAVKSQGMNPYLCEIANIREQCSWVHQKEKGEATQKAEEIIKATLQKVRKNEMVEAIAVDINRRVLVGELLESLPPSIWLKVVTKFFFWREKLRWVVTWPSCQGPFQISILLSVVSSQRHWRWRSIPISIFTVIQN